MKNKAVKIGIAATLLPHVFCCGLPIALSLIGLFTPEVAHTQIIPAWLEPWLFVVSGIMLGISWVLVLRDCRCACDHCHGGANHHFQKILLGVITAIFVLSVVIHILLEY